MIKALLCFLFLMDIWIEAPAGFYILSLDSNGVPIITPAPEVTGIERMGQTPVPPPPPDVPGQDTWGLIELSRTEALKVNDPQKLIATKLNIAYTETGKKVQEGVIPENLLARTLDLIFDAATGSNKQAWIPWKDATHGKYNTIPFNNAQDAGQGLIDIGTGLPHSANGEWLKIFLEVILPLILKLLGLG